MRKLIAISAVLVILTVFVSAASACVPGTAGCPGIKVPTASFPSGSFITHSSGDFSGGLNGGTEAAAVGSCAAESTSATKITQVGNGGLIESGGVAAANGFPSIAQSDSVTTGSATFTGSGSATGYGVQ